MLAAACGSTYTLNENNTGQLVDYSAEKPDSAIQQLILPYSKIYHSNMNEVVGYLGADMEKGFPEGTLGNFFADVFFDQAVKEQLIPAGDAFALFNNGGLRVPLQKGAITRGKVFELMPFENKLVGVELKGKYLVNELAAYLLAKKGQPVSYNVSIVFKGDQLVKMEVSGQPVDTSKTYVVLTSDYLFNGGDNMDFFKHGSLVGDMQELKLRDGLIDYFQKNSSVQNPLQPPAMGRIKME